MKRYLEELHEPSVEPQKRDNLPFCANCGELMFEAKNKFLTSFSGDQETHSHISFCCQECKYYYLLQHSLQYPYSMTLERARDQNQLPVETIIKVGEQKRRGVKVTHEGSSPKCITCLRVFPWKPIDPCDYGVNKTDWGEWTWCSRMCAARHFETHLEQRNLRQLESFCLSKGQPMGLRHSPDDLASGKISYDTFLRETVQRTSGLGTKYRTVVIDRPDILPTLFEDEEMISEKSTSETISESET